MIINDSSVGWSRVGRRVRSPHRMQRLLGEAAWDTDAVRDDLRRYAVEQLADPAALLIRRLFAKMVANAEARPPQPIAGRTAVLFGRDGA